MSSWSVLFIVCYKNRPCFSTIHGSRAIQRENRVAGTCHPAALSPAGYVFATVNTEWMLSRGTVWLYLSSFHFPGNQFDLPFWILKYETINSSCLVLNSARSKQLVHAAVREAVDRGVTSARQSGGSAINLFFPWSINPLGHWSIETSSCTVSWIGPRIPPVTAWPQGFTPHLAQVPVVLCLRCPQNQRCYDCKRWRLQTWELRSSCSPSKQTFICDSQFQCINRDRATCVFCRSKAPVEVVWGDQALQWCFTAFCRLLHLLWREGRVFIRPKGAVGGEPSRHFRSTCWIHVLSLRQGKLRSWGCYLFWSKSGICETLDRNLLAIEVSICPAVCLVLPYEVHW